MLRQKQVANLYSPSVAVLGADTDVALNEIVLVADLNAFFKIVAIGANVVDGLNILATGNVALVATRVGDEGIVVGSAATLAALPNATLYSGKFSILTAQDTVNEAGLYYSNGATWIFFGIDAPHHHTLAGVPSVTEDADTGYLVGGVIVDTLTADAFVTVDHTAGAAVHRKITGGMVIENLTIAVVDTVPNLGSVPSGIVILFVNGISESVATGAFTNAGAVITWTGAYTLATTDVVQAMYSV